MKRISILTMTLSAYSIWGFAQEQQATLPHKFGPQRTRVTDLNPRSQLLRGQSLHLPASATPHAVQVTCPLEAVGAVCGYVEVPLDRRHSDQKKIKIYFELYTHSGSGPAESAILAAFGGPGYSATAARGFFQFLFAANFDVHDLLLIDDRGRGLSGTIRCKELQHATAPFQKAEADCAAQLNDAASRYGTGDIAQDTEAVRAALGYDKVDYFGFSYGGTDITAYATRFGDHLRSLVLDAPLGTPALKPFVFDRYRARSETRMVVLDCQRSPNCAPDHADPVAEFSKVIATIRAHPIQGNAFDANGNLVPVTINERTLLEFVIGSPTGAFISTGELLAASAALEKGDKAPLLRLGAEGFFPRLSDQGDPTIGVDVGAHYATPCVDASEPWDWSAPVAQRIAQYADAVSALPSDYFAPFSRKAVTGSFSFFGWPCLHWEKPTASSPVALTHAAYPHVPTLVLDGDMDNSVPLEETHRVASLFPDSTFVRVAEAGHITVFWTACAQMLVSQFIENLASGDTSCASTPEAVFPAVGRFPLLAADARPAKVDPNGQNHIGQEESRVVTTAVAVATDAMQRSIIGFGDGVGLRAGTFHTDYADSWTTTLTDCAFARDVVVNGTVTWAADLSFIADLTVSGSGTSGGTLHIEGTWQAPGTVGNFKVSGVLGGRHVAVLVPEA